MFVSFPILKSDAGIFPMAVSFLLIFLEWSLSQGKPVVSMLHKKGALNRALSWISLLLITRPN